MLSLCREEVLTPRLLSAKCYVTLMVPSIVNNLYYNSCQVFQKKGEILEKATAAGKEKGRKGGWEVGAGVCVCMESRQKH